VRPCESLDVLSGFGHMATMPVGVDGGKDQSHTFIQVKVSETRATSIISGVPLFIRGQEQKISHT
jgi:hypothetical protein